MARDRQRELCRLEDAIAVRWELPERQPLDERSYSAPFKGTRTLDCATCRCPDHGWHRWRHREDRSLCAVSLCLGLSGSSAPPVQNVSAGLTREGRSSGALTTTLHNLFQH